MSGPRSPSIVLVDDHELFRSGVRAELEGRVEILGEAGSVEEAVGLILERSPTSSCSTSICRVAAVLR